MVKTAAQSALIAQYSGVAKAQLLRENSVEAWEGYGAALDDYGYQASSTTEGVLCWLRALELGGVDSWEGYDEVSQEVAGYEAYLEELPEEVKPLSFEEYRKHPSYFNESARGRRLAALGALRSFDMSELAEITKRPVRKPEDTTEELLLSYLKLKFPAHHRDLFEEFTHEGLLWDASVFPQEAALLAEESGDKLGASVPETQRGRLVELIIKSGALDAQVKKRVEEWLRATTFHSS